MRKTPRQTRQSDSLKSAFCVPPSGGLGELEMRGRPSPPGWVWTTLAEVTNTQRKRVKPQDYPHLKFVGMDNIEAHTMRLLGTVPANEMKSSAEYFEPNDVLYGRLRPYLNKVFRPDFEGLCSAEFIAFRKVSHLESKYLQYFLNSAEFVLFASRLNTGDRPRINFAQIADYPFPLPPLLEQQRIVAEIEKQMTRLDAGVAALKRAQARLRRYKAAVLKAACEGQLTPQNPDDKSAEKRWGLSISPQKRDDLPKIPNNWVYRELQDISERVSVGYVGPTSEHYCDESEGVPFLRSQNVRPGRINFANLRYITKEFHQETKKSQLKPGDLLIVRVGANRGDSCVLPDVFEEVNCANVVFARPFEGISNYLNWYFQTKMCQDLMLDMTTGSAQGVINTKSVARVPVPIPPLAEQQRIVAEVERRLSVVEEMETALEANLKRAERLRQAILKQAFAGRLAPQDPSDEPASALLARIQAEQEKGEPKKKGDQQLRLPGV